MTKREKLQKKYKLNLEKIVDIEAANEEIYKKMMLLSDEKQQFEEKHEIFNKYNGRKVEKIKRLIGRIHWKETINDMDTNESIIINRTQIVRVDGNWV